MRSHRFAVLLSALLGTAAQAQDSIYVGVGFGGFDYQESFDDIFFGRVSDSVDTYKIFGGFEFNEHFALEMSYRETGDIKQVGSAVLDPVGLVTDSLTSDFKMTNLVATGQFVKDWGVLLGGLGFFSSDNDVREDLTLECCEPLTLESSIRDDGLSAMLGIEWRFGRFGTRYGIHLEYEWWDIDAADASAVGISFSYGF